MKKKIEQWKRDLIDISRRNRLLFFKPTKRKHIIIDSPAPASIFERLAVNKKGLKTPSLKEEDYNYDYEQSQLLFEQDDNQIIESPMGKAEKSVQDKSEITASIPQKQMETALYHMRMQSKTALEEQGVNILFMAVGFLEWYEAKHSDESARSPLILIPVEIKSSKGNRSYEINPLDDEVFVNPTLEYVLNMRTNLKYPIYLKIFVKQLTITKTI